MPLRATRAEYLPLQQAERTGFVSPAFRNTLPGSIFNNNRFRRNELGQSGCSRLLPVISGRGGHQPGQKRDNFSRPIFTLESILGVVLILSLAVGMVRADEGQVRPRTKAEIRSERTALYERTSREIDQIVAQFHDKLSRQAANGIGAIYCRYSTRFQDSIGDQVRKIMEEAVRLGIFVPRENILFDLAVRGYKSQRAGLDQLRQLLRQKKVSVVMFFATNRLFRKVHRTLEFVEEEVVERGIDAIFVKSGVDTRDKDRWRMLLTFHSMMDEFVVGMYADNIRAAHEGLMEKRLVFGTISYGYGGEPIDGETTRRGRPRRKLIIDECSSAVVRQVFDWYVVERLTIDEIIRRLNDDPDIPLTPRCTTGMWTRLAVKNILTNSRYRGCWQYGVTESVWISSKDYARQRERGEPLKEAQIEDLRIVPDQVWFRAQDRLNAEKRHGGRRSRDGDRQSRPKVLNGLLWCPDHDRPLVVAGPNGRSMLCPCCRRLKAERRPLYSHLNRKLALRLTCEKIAELVRADESLIQTIIDSCRREVERLQSPDPAQIERLKAQEQQLTSRIHFVMSNVGATGEDQREASSILSELRGQRTTIRAELTSAEACSRETLIVPSEEQVRTFLMGFEDVLVSAADGHMSEQSGQVHAIISELTGGRIELVQMGERMKGRGWLQARFTVDILSTAIAKVTGTRIARDGVTGVEVVIDYRAIKLIDQQAEQAQQLWHQDLLNQEIAERMGCLASYVTKLLHHWFDSRGLPRPDGRRRRARLAKKQMAMPVYKQLADKVVQLVDMGLSNLAIAKQLRTSDATVAKVIKWWSSTRQTPVPTTKERRLKMLERAKQLYEDGVLLKEIASEADYTPRGMKLALEKYYVDLGEKMPDGRTRRGNANVGQLVNGHRESQQIVY